jgi:hypothetical protein
MFYLVDSIMPREKLWRISNAEITGELSQSKERCYSLFKCNLRITPIIIVKAAAPWVNLRLPYNYPSFTLRLC